jgi:hypothetical protein
LDSLTASAQAGSTEAVGLQVVGMTAEGNLLDAGGLTLSTKHTAAGAKFLLSGKASSFA